MNYSEVAQLLLKHNSFLLVTHKNPDGDTIGSAAALCSALRRKGKKAFLYPNPQVTEKFRTFAEPYFAPDKYKPKYIVCIDTPTEELEAEGFEGKANFCIDHHPTNTHYAQADFVQSEKSSCGEIILAVIEAMCNNVTTEEANLLYIAVTTDTGCFQYSNTNSATLNSAARLLDYGADNAALNTLLFRKISAARMKLEGMIYNSMSLHRDGKIAIATVTNDMMQTAGATEDDCDDLSALAGKVKDSVVSVTIREKEDGKCRISVRSTKEVSSSDICAVFGGGGHAMAAGCSISASPDKAKELILAVIDEIWK